MVNNQQTQAKSSYTSENTISFRDKSQGTRLNIGPAKPPGSKNTIYYLIAIGIFVLLKYAYTISNTHDLSFLLSPTNKLVGILTNSPWDYSIDNGYFYPQLHIFIDKSCSGFNFWILCFLILVFSTINNLNSRASNKTHKILAFIFSLLGAYIVTVIVNSLRIYASIVIQKNKLEIFNLDQGITHEAIGILTNLFFLVLIYLFVEKSLKRKQNLNKNQRAKSTLTEKNNLDFEAK